MFWWSARPKSGPTRDRPAPRAPRQAVLLQMPGGAGAGGMLMGATDHRVHADGPRNPASCVTFGLQRRRDLAPRPVALPAEEVVDGRPGCVFGRDVTPRRTDPDPPPDPVDELPFLPLRRTTLPDTAGSSGASRCHCALAADRRDGPSAAVVVEVLPVVGEDVGVAQNGGQGSGVADFVAEHADDVEFESIGHF